MKNICKILVAWFLSSYYISVGQNKILLENIAEPSLFELLNVDNALIIYQFSKNDPIIGSAQMPLLDFMPLDTAFSCLTKKTIGNQNLIGEFYLLIFNYKTDAPVVFISETLNFVKSKKIILSSQKTVSLIFKTNSGGSVGYFITKEKRKMFMQSSSIPHINSKPLDDVYWLKIKDNHTKVGDVTYKKEKYSIAVSDINHNGIYNEVGIDKVFIGNEKQRYFEVYDPEDNFNSCSIKKELVYEVNGKKYAIFNISSNGEVIMFKNYIGESKIHIHKLERIPSFTFLTSTGDSLSILEIKEKGKYLYLDIWATFCNPCIKDLPLLDSIQEEYKNKITIVGLLDKSSLDQLNQIVQKYNIKNIQGLSSLEITKILLLSGYPHGILFSKEGKLIKIKMSVNELSLYLKEN
ncbi:MAG: TlpA family protein disulfide reductase [Chitinophagaceae bacterium]|nr:TlpA family protein disulfide reductase [Chitinophagaceae bacterium]